MSRYRLDLRDIARRQLKAVLPDRLRTEMVQAMLDLRDDPRPFNSELQRELQDRYRLKIDDWRIFYKIDDKDRVVTVLEIRPKNRNTYLNVP